MRWNLVIRLQHYCCCCRCCCYRQSLYISVCIWQHAASSTVVVVVVVVVTDKSCISVCIWQHAATNTVVVVTDKACISVCIDNMQRVQELSPIELVEMFVTVFCFLKDSSDVSQMLLDDFRSCNGYLFLSDFLIKYAFLSVSTPWTFLFL